MLRLVPRAAGGAVRVLAASQTRGMMLAPTGIALDATPGKVRVIFITPDGDRKLFMAKPGMTLMETARTNKIDMEAACDGTCACSTCHVYLDKESYAKLPKPSEDELDMLDLAPDVKETSRLACQIELTEALDGIEAELPSNIESQF
jgi:ferredoxin